MESSVVLEGVSHSYDGDLDKGRVNCETTYVKSQEDQQPSTYEEEVVGKETLLARRQESLDSVHLVQTVTKRFVVGEESYRESRIFVLSKPFVVDVLLSLPVAALHLFQRLEDRMETTLRATLKRERQGSS